MQTRVDSEWKPPKWWFDNLLNALNELSSIAEQERLWLSDGSGGKDVGSFTEACCGIFDDLTVGDLLEKNRLHAVTSDKFAALMSRLSIHLDNVDETVPPEDVIASREMKSVRKLALTAYLELKSISV
jgi:hypothetical protein